MTETVELTQAELADRIRRVEEVHRVLEARMAFVRSLERELILCAVVVYLAGIFLGVVIAKQWWGL